MNTKLLLLAPLLLVVTAGCLSSEPSADEVRDAVVGNEVSSYVYETERVVGISVWSGGPTRTLTVTTEGRFDYENREMRAVTETVRNDSGGFWTDEEVVTGANTTTYLVDGRLYMRTVGEFVDSDWVYFEDTDDGVDDVGDTWRARDDLGFYIGVLEDVDDVRYADEQPDDEVAVLVLELTDDEQKEFLAGRFVEEPEFFDETGIESFEAAYHVKNDRLVRVETDVVITAPERETEAGTVDYGVSISFVSEFGYDEPVVVELPDEAVGAEPARA